MFQFQSNIFFIQRSSEIEVWNSRVMKSSYEIKLRKMTSHFELLTRSRKIKTYTFELLTRRSDFYFSTFELLTRS